MHFIENSMYFGHCLIDFDKEKEKYLVTDLQQILHCLKPEYNHFFFKLY